VIYRLQLTILTAGMSDVSKRFRYTDIAGLGYLRSSSDRTGQRCRQSRLNCAWCSEEAFFKLDQRTGSTTDDRRLSNGFILKPPTEEYDSLPEFEDLAMRLADLVGIQTVPHALIRLNNQYAYITRRIDRDVQKGTVRLYAMEDFCQLSNRLTQDKYRGSYENCGRIIRKYSTRAGLDMTELFLRVAFSFIIGNSDMHLKNFSLRESSPGSREFTLSGAYDLLPVNVIYLRTKTSWR
jgi:hypothetical protein